MGKIGILYRHDDGKTTQMDMRAWDFSPWVKEKLGRAARHALVMRHEPDLAERQEVQRGIEQGEIAASDVEAFITRRRAEALLDLLHELEVLVDVFLDRGLVVLQPKGIPTEDLPSTRLTDEERAALKPRLV